MELAYRGEKRPGGLQCRRAPGSEAQSASWLGSILHHHPGILILDGSPASRIFAWDVGTVALWSARGLCVVCGLWPVLRKPCIPVARGWGYGAGMSG